jgi:lysophospholipase L1-like esterase
MANILALGDCNTLGIKDNQNNTYVEKVATILDKSVQNCGYTMSTTREMLYFFQDYYADDTEMVLIQYGLVDSWKTFKYAPYILYYPDNVKRKIFRKIVKKYKKIAKSLGFNDIFGVENVVPSDEYKQNIIHIIKKAKHSKVFLIDTVPNMDKSRNDEICRYNSALEQISNEYDVAYIKLYDLFLDKSEYYLDATHLNARGYQLIANKIIKLYRNLD